MKHEHTNIERETILIERRLMHGIHPVQVLVIHDDPPPVGTGTQAPMRLDRHTVQWLRGVLEPGYIFDQGGDPIFDRGGDR